MQSFRVQCSRRRFRVRHVSMPVAASMVDAKAAMDCNVPMLRDADIDMVSSARAIRMSLQLTVLMCGLSHQSVASYAVVLSLLSDFPMAVAVVMMRCRNAVLIVVLGTLMPVVASSSCRWSYCRYYRTRVPETRYGENGTRRPERRSQGMKTYSTQYLK